MLRLHLQHPMLTFIVWLEVRMKDLVIVGAIINEELIQLSCLPSQIAYTYSSIWTYGNHFRMDLETTRLTHLAYDVGIACIFNQANQSSMRDQNIIIENLNYVGVLKKFLLVDYSKLHLVLFSCSWIPPNLCGNARTICQDEHGFWQVNFRCWLPPTMEPYVFPIIIFHVLTSISRVPLENHTYKHKTLSD